MAKPKSEPAKKGQRQAELNEIGIDAICARLRSGQMGRAIARELGISDATLSEWLSGDPERSARAVAARAQGAAAWDEMAEETIDALPADATQAQVAQMREKVQHYRWRASKLGRADYGEKIEHAGAGGGPVQIEIVRFGE